MPLCGFIYYVIKNKFATNNDYGVSQELIYLYYRNSPAMKVNDVANNVVNDTRINDDQHADTSTN